MKYLLTLLLVFASTQAVFGFGPFVIPNSKNLIPHDIYLAYSNAVDAAPYVCRRTSIAEIDAQFSQSFEIMRQRYDATFGDDFDPPIASPTNCPSASEPRMQGQIEKYRAAVKAFAESLELKPKPEKPE